MQEESLFLNILWEVIFLCKAIDLALNDKIKVVANFLAWYLELENDYGVIDKLSRARNDKDVMDCLYVALRVKDRLKRIAQERRKVPENVFEEKVIPRPTVIEEILKYASECPQIVGGVLAILALSMRPYPAGGEK